MNFDLAGNAKLFSQAAAFFAVKSRRVGLVNHQPGAVFFFEFDQIAQQREVAIHRENRFRHDERARTAFAAQSGVAPVGPAKNLRQMIEIVVCKDAQFCAAKAGAINDAGVHPLVDDNHVMGVQQGANGPYRRSITAGKCERRLRAFESSDGLLQLVVRRKRTADQPRRA